MNNLLITGASGFLGWNLCQAEKSRWNVTGALGAQDLAMPGVKMAHADLADPSAIERLFRSARPDAVVHAAAMSKPAAVDASPEQSYRVNVLGSIYIARLCADCGIPMVFTSSGLVFDGTRAPYVEDDPICPPNLYGRQKAEAEAEILKIHPRAAVCRLAWTFGPPAPKNLSLIQPMLEAARRGEEMREFSDIYCRPTSARAVMQGIMLALKDGWSGVWHLCGTETVSRYEFAKTLFDVYEISGANLKPRSREEVQGPPSPPDTSLDSSKAIIKGYNPLAIAEELRLLRKAG
jgi:dTDP-4-dehydrorhamnose reductase